MRLLAMMLSKRTLKLPWMLTLQSNMLSSSLGMPIVLYTRPNLVAWIGQSSPDSWGTQEGFGCVQLFDSAVVVGSPIPSVAAAAGTILVQCAFIFRKLQRERYTPLVPWVNHGHSEL